MFFTMGVLLKTNNMKISQVIEKLQGFQTIKGDLQVRIIIDENDVSIDAMAFVTDNRTLYIRPWSTKKI